MKPKKKFDPEELKAIIIEKFGSIEEYAKKFGVTRSAMYQRIDAQAVKFLRELERDGVIIAGSTNTGIVTSRQSGNNYQNSAEMDTLKKELEIVTRERDLFKKEVELLQKEIDLLKRNHNIL